MGAVSPPPWGAQGNAHVLCWRSDIDSKWPSPIAGNVETSGIVCCQERTYSKCAEILLIYVYRNSAVPVVRLYIQELKEWDFLPTWEWLSFVHFANLLSVARYASFGTCQQPKPFCCNRSTTNMFMISNLSRALDVFSFFLSLWIDLWLAETSQQPISQTTWLKVSPHCNHCL